MIFGVLPVVWANPVGHRLVRERFPVADQRLVWRLAILEAPRA
jgi:hypothetical protein